MHARAVAKVSCSCFSSSASAGGGGRSRGAWGWRDGGSGFEWDKVGEKGGERVRAGVEVEKAEGELGRAAFRLGRGRERWSSEALGGGERERWTAGVR